MTISSSCWSPTEDPSPEKNDWRDARSIADLGRQGKFNGTTLPGPVYEDLRSLARMRAGLIERRSAQKHRLRAMLVRNFPELPSIVSDILGKSVSALLKKALIAVMGKLVEIMFSLVRSRSGDMREKPGRHYHPTECLAAELDLKPYTYLVNG